MPDKLCRVCLKIPTSNQFFSVKERYGKWTLGYMFTAVTTYKIEGKRNIKQNLNCNDKRKTKKTGKLNISKKMFVLRSQKRIDYTYKLY